jgi:hypothetical protein
VDLDDCRDGGGSLHPAAAALVEKLDSYTEVSPSGTGIKVWLRAELSGFPRNRTSTTVWGGEFEVYDRGRYFTVTGSHLRGTPAEVRDRQAQLELVLDLVFGDVKTEPTTSTPAHGGFDGDDHALLEVALRSKNGEKFARLWGGDTTGYGSESEADLALIAMLAFWAGPAPDRIDRLFRLSQLYREKWERADYRAATIAKALDGRTDYFHPSRPDDPDSRTNSRNGRSHAGSGRPGDGRTASGQPPVLASESRILDVFSADLRRRGVAGEERLGRLIYLALTSRLLPWGRATNRPVSLLIRGTTSTGKSWTLTAVVEFFPADAVVDLGSMSRRFLFYDEESYSHRVLLIPEAAQVIDDDDLLALLRTLLSEGRVVHGTVVGEGKPTAQKIVKEGPTALVTSTTRAYLDDELETRMSAVAANFFGSGVQCL